MRTRLLTGVLAAGLLLAAGCNPSESGAPAAASGTTAAAAADEPEDLLAGRERVMVAYSANAWGELLECG